MIKKITLLLFLIVNTILAQNTDYNNSKKFLKNNFNSIRKISNVKYGEAKNFIGANKELLLDIYFAEEDISTNKPLLVLFFGGGFVKGSKEQQSIVELCDSFARKGYVTVSVEYRLGTNGTGNSQNRAIYRGIQDGHAALRYLTHFSETYNIDTNFIFIGGASAGSFITMHLAYMQEYERPIESYGGVLSSDLGCISCSGNPYQDKFKVKAVIDFWGALLDSSFRESHENTPILIFHGTEDDLVHYDKGKPFNLPQLNEIHGAIPLVNQSKKYNLPYEFHPIVGSGHGPWGGKDGEFSDSHPKNEVWDYVAANTNLFLHNNIKPKNKINIIGEENPNIGTATTYYFSGKDYKTTYKYNIEGGTIISHSDTSITVVWSNSSNYSINVVEENSLSVWGDEYVLEVTPIFNNLSVYPNPVNKILSVNSSFNSNEAIYLFQSNGKLILEKKLNRNSFEIDMSNLKNGAYFIKVVGDNKVITKKIIKN